MEREGKEGGKDKEWREGREGRRGGMGGGGEGGALDMGSAPPLKTSSGSAPGCSV